MSVPFLRGFYHGPSLTSVNHILLDRGQTARVRIDVVYRADRCGNFHHPKDVTRPERKSTFKEPIPWNSIVCLFFPDIRLQKMGDPCISRHSTRCIHTSSPAVVAMDGRSTLLATPHKQARYWSITDGVFRPWFSRITAQCTHLLAFLLFRSPFGRGNCRTRRRHPAPGQTLMYIFTEEEENEGKKPHYFLK